MTATSQRPARIARPPMHERFQDRRRQVRRRAIRRRRRVVLSVLGLVALLLAVAGLARSPLFEVAEVTVSGVEGEEAGEARAAAGLGPGDNVLLTDVGAVAEQVEALPWVREASVTRAPPSQIDVAVVPRRPVAVVRLTESSWQVDAEGIVLGGGQAEGLPVIDAPNSVLPGVGMEVSDAAVNAALRIRRQLPAAMRLAIDRFEAASPHGVRLLIRDGDAQVWVRFGDDSQVLHKARVVRLLLDQVDAERARRAADDPLGQVELDVRAPDTPVLVPDSTGQVGLVEPGGGEPDTAVSAPGGAGQPGFDRGARWAG